ncbi:hypothetical protein A5819_001354 [Enterococcus sp. 7E2_DIV0204]|uniref:DUF3324 domain-containing protein n=1 Tax=Candidatus Enterococcus lemimoniae TaxID=1834167 RepID=A0ABZ2T6R8_9ENTE|nr:MULTISPECIES: DUF916 and DUF3324 domain-containing protein [unclassified Enterococcus]OTN88862.1 hypothetical protein A5819_001354 [Enterococcus sp. 7E2_DIV0204]OTO71031.1 hypothetical protein A5866_003281 [Enterococcus sp. 12C11_DIV0727]OTP51328.1 hypothetical protein A5884_000523 [Enterococcus sp. 7D2_DIV0200]
MKKKILTWLAIILYIGVNSTFLSTTGLAAKEDGSGFTYKVIQPENQHNKEVGYFDLRMTPSQEQTVTIKMNNSSSAEITVEVALNSAKTNTNGVVEYGPSKLEKDKSLKYDFADLVKGEKTVKIPANQSVDYTLDIKMPNAQFDGAISGGIYMIQKGQTESQDAMIKNEYGYLVGMILTETDTVITPELKLNTVFAEQQNYRNAVFINYSNIAPVYLDDMTVDVQIMKKGSDEVLYDTKQNKMRMAPNSQINFPVLMNGEKMQAGDYRAHILVTAENNGKWEWEQEFKITDEEADKFNQEDVSLLQESRINWLLIIALALGGVVLIVIIFFTVRFFRQKNKKKARKKKKSGNKKR